MITPNRSPQNFFVKFLLLCHAAVPILYVSRTSQSTVVKFLEMPFTDLPHNEQDDHIMLDSVLLKTPVLGILLLTKTLFLP